MGASVVKQFEIQDRVPGVLNYYSDDLNLLATPMDVRLKKFYSGNDWSTCAFKLVV